MEKVKCCICYEIVGELNDLSLHLRRVQGLTLNRGGGRKGFVCQQDECGRNFLHFSSLKNHIKKCHILVTIDKNPPPTKEVPANQLINKNENMEVDEKELRSEQIDIENSEFDAKAAVSKMIAEILCNPSVNAALLTNILNEFEIFTERVHRSVYKKVSTFLTARRLLDNPSAEELLETIKYDNPFCGTK